MDGEAPPPGAGGGAAAPAAKGKGKDKAKAAAPKDPAKAAREERDIVVAVAQGARSGGGERSSARHRNSGGLKHRYEVLGTPRVG